MELSPTFSSFYHAPPLEEGWLCQGLPLPARGPGHPLPPPNPTGSHHHLLEAVPFSSGAPEVLSQGIQELAQLLRAHGHFLSDQLQVL